ncbi:hypothetical protein PINS_up019044 [Pythium insidiosum]|nr:hypothetical protein PINS_up019044 [Pythium insidiosum]
MEESNNLLLFSVPLDSLDADALRFFIMRRARVLKQIQQEMAEELKDDTVAEAPVVEMPHVETPTEDVVAVPSDRQVDRDTDDANDADSLILESN